MVLAAGIVRPGDSPSRKDEAGIAVQGCSGSGQQSILADAAGADHQEKSARRIHVRRLRPGRCRPPAPPA